MPFINLVQTSSYLPHGSSEIILISSVNISTHVGNCFKCWARNDSRHYSRHQTALRLNERRHHSLRYPVQKSEIHLNMFPFTFHDPHIHPIPADSTCLTFVSPNSSPPSSHSCCFRSGPYHILFGLLL